MHDPLGGFEWNSLLDGYDSLCSSFRADVPYLSEPLMSTESDRELYSLLIREVERDRARFGGVSIPTYQGILYWKLYSQPAAVRNICHPLYKDPDRRNTLENCLCRLTNVLPEELERSPTQLINLVRRFDDLGLYGMASPSALPARTTLLHFVFPDVVPIFDKMVLAAVGITEKHANQSLSILNEYIPFAWQMAANHRENLEAFNQYSALRVIDMALWVNRGSQTRCEE